MQFNSFGPAVGRLGSDSSRGAKLRQSRSRGAEPPPPIPLTLTTACTVAQRPARLVPGLVTAIYVNYVGYGIGVDGSCAKHLTVESYMVSYASNSYTYYY